MSRALVELSPQAQSFKQAPGFRPQSSLTPRPQTRPPDRPPVHYLSSLKSWQSAHSHLELSPSTLRPARIYRQLADHRRKLKYTRFLRAIRTFLTESLAENVHPAEDRQDPALGHRRRCRARVHHPPSQESMFRPHKYNDQMGRVIE